MNLSEPINDLRQKILALKREKNAVILAHTYQPGEVQDIADFVGDSYGLSVEATKVRADIIVFCGVRFMAETAAILNPSRTVILAEADAGCPMAEMIEPSDVHTLRARYPHHLVMCYVNSSVEVKALADICCTSSNALRIARKLPADKGIIFIPDYHLGDWIQEQTGRDIVLWKGFCPTHARITEAMLHRARAEHPDAMVLIHPEAPRSCRHLADRVLSTGEMCTLVQQAPHNEFVIATEVGILHTLQKANPHKRFYPLDNSITCPNMRRGSLRSIVAALEGTGGLTIRVPDTIAERARQALKSMLDLSA